MHLNKILDQIKHHPSPTEAIDKLGKALEKHEGSLLEKGFQILKSELCANVYEAINGPHFDEEHASSTIGLTIATDKTQIVDMVKQSYNDCKVKKESVLKYDEEMRRCEDILKLLNTTPDITTNVTKDFKELDELKAEVKELKQLLQNVTTVRPEVKIETPSSEEKQIEI